MSDAPQLDPLAEAKRLDVTANQAIPVCDGDMRATVNTLANLKPPSVRG